MYTPNHAEIMVDSPDVLHGINIARVAQYQLRPEWLRVNDAIQIFPISRSKLYEFIAAGKVRSFCLRERNKVKGIRCISYDSLSEFFEREAKAQEVPVSA
jgi:hypothetical protein